MYQLILLIHVFVAVCIVALVLVQQGKGAAMGAGFGGGSSQTVFGSRGSGSFLFRVTIAFALVFFATSIGLNFIATSAYKHRAITKLPFSNEKTAIPSVPEVPVTGNESANQAPVSPADIPVKK